MFCPISVYLYLRNRAKIFLPLSCRFLPCYGLNGVYIFLNDYSSE